jgi:hypothetical protein
LFWCFVLLLMSGPWSKPIIYSLYSAKFWYFQSTPDDSDVHQTWSWWPSLSHESTAAPESSAFLCVAKVVWSLGRKWWLQMQQFLGQPARQCYLYIRCFWK